MSEPEPKGKRRRRRVGQALDGATSIGDILDAGPVGWAMALIGGALVVVAGVFGFMNKRS